MIGILINRYVFIFLYILIIITMIFYTYYQFSNTKNYIYNLHNSFKNFLFLLKNSPSYNKVYLNEAILRRIVKEYHLSLKSISKIGNKYVVEIEKVPSSKLIRFLITLEKNGIITSFKAIDNTGMGNFYLQIEITSRMY